jgi:diguanylate cyclase (GGDEF)-like protein
MPAAQAVNLRRARYVAPGVVAVNGVCVLWLGISLLTRHEPSTTEEWKLGLLLVHLLMGLCFGFLAWQAYRLRHSPKSFWGRQLPVLMVGLGLLLALALTSLDQWITPNITPFLLGSIAISLAVYLRPGVSAWVFAAVYVLFYHAIGLTQDNAQQLLSNRVNGLAAVAIGWGLSVLLWRKFTTITLQQAQLEEANAELQSKQKELQRLTRLDGLTGLYNRNTFVELTRQELVRAQRQGSSTTILLLDLDFFKRVNDTWGHPAGDAVLKNVASVANSTVRATDLVGRLGGEEFIILLPNTSLEAARKLAEKLRANLEHTPTPWEQTRITSTVSIGVASTTASENRDFDHLYSHADKALYAAKEKGRNRVV